MIFILFKSTIIPYQHGPNNSALMELSLFHNTIFHSYNDNNDIPFMKAWSFDYSLVKLWIL